MPDIVLFDNDFHHENLLPLSFTRPLSEFRVGITTISEKWKLAMHSRVFTIPVEYLHAKFRRIPDDVSDLLFVAGNALPSAEVCGALVSLTPGKALVEESFDPENPERHKVLAFRGSYKDFMEWNFRETVKSTGWLRINFVFDVFLMNAAMIREDFVRITKGRESQPLPESCKVIGPYTDENGLPLIFLEEGAEAECATFNTKNGPIYIGANATVMEGSHLQGPLALCSKGKIRMGSKIYGGCTFGPYCKVGGEVDNSVIFGYSNKAHDGYLGNAVIGEWCNIGAGVNASNLKNDYTKIRIWNYRTRSFMRTDLQFCGLIMGDHSKIGINSMLNTASVIGVGVNLHGAGFPRVFIPSFSEGSPAGGFTDVSLKKFYDIAQRVMSRRNIVIDSVDREIFQQVYEVANSLKRK